MAQDNADIQRIEIVNDDEDASWGKWAPLLYYAVDLVALYYVTHPDTFERHKEFVTGLWRKAQHRVSVWQTRQAIHSLPTTDITGIIDNETR